LYIYLRSHLNQEWSRYIEQVVESLNSIPLKHLGYLRPNDIKSVTSSVEVDKNLKEHGLPVPKEPTFKEQIQNQQNYEQKQDSTVIQKGDYVYLKQDEKVFGKSFDIQGITLTFCLSYLKCFAKYRIGVLKNLRNFCHQTAGNIISV